MHCKYCLNRFSHRIPSGPTFLGARFVEHQDEGREIVWPGAAQREKKRGEALKRFRQTTYGSRLWDSGYGLENVCVPKVTV